MGKAYVTVFNGMRGWFAVIMDDEGPWQSGIMSYEKREDAVKDAKEWAKAEDIEYKGGE